MNDNRKHFCGLSNLQPDPIGIGKCGLECSFDWIPFVDCSMQAHVMWLSRKMADTPNSPKMKCTVNAKFTKQDVLNHWIWGYPLLHETYMTAYDGSPLAAGNQEKQATEGQWAAGSDFW